MPSIIVLIFQSPELRVPEMMFSDIPELTYTYSNTFFNTLINISELDDIFRICEFAQY